MAGEKTFWDFEVLNDENFKLVVRVVNVKDKLFEWGMKRSLRKLNVSASPEDLINNTGSFIVPKDFYPLLALSITSLIKNIKKDVKRDGIKVLSWEIKEAWYEKKKKFYDIRFIIGGDYAR